MKVFKKIICCFLWTILICSCGNSLSRNEEDNLEFKGADISWFDQIESLGGKYYAGGKEASIFDILKMGNVNWIRLRLWVNPELVKGENWCNLDRTVEMAKRIKDEGFKFLLDFHYSDSWVDPSQQKIPEAWSKLSYQELVSKIGSYTEECLLKFKENGCRPDMIQTGNEITNGMLWPYGTTEGGDCTKLMELLKSAGSACKKICPEARIMLHLDAGTKNELCSWWFGEAVKANVNFDVIGLSYYAFFHGTDLSVLGKNIESLKEKFKKQVCVVETSYPWTFGWKDSCHNQIGEGAEILSDCPATVEGQKKYLKKLVKTVYSAGGSGIFYWEPDAVCVTGFDNPLENQSWFDFDNNWTGIGF